MNHVPLPDSRTLVEAVLATWPPASIHREGAWTIREGKGGGSRVSSATEDWPVTEADLPTAEAAMRALGQTPQFMVRDGEGALDNLLAAHGYEVKDPTNLWAADARRLAGDGAFKMGMCYAMWPPLNLIRDIWQDGGIGPERQAVMERAGGPKAGVLMRSGDYPGGAAFVAIHDNLALIHALHVLPDERRKGVARQIVKRCAVWALDHGADVIGLAVTQGNTAANPLYAALGMTLRGQYHYRIKSEEA
ncbi:MAG: GNAT family N-acetyltransferase [Maritimibacter sp.]|uniref:GNAT family N-acetyltransferase n=1 Tax=Maritimibacter sp. TaxID=2003363 RepID=UPI001DF4F770|nr:GNAT family N-acetyltransferase [Maritimibacter sp.]MBL6427271.1 GNAT family N-acetyltransferase [Maritimibacter sp.]